MNGSRPLNEGRRKSESSESSDSSESDGSNVSLLGNNTSSNQQRPSHSCDNLVIETNV